VLRLCLNPYPHLRHTEHLPKSLQEPTGLLWPAVKTCVGYDARWERPEEESVLEGLMPAMVTPFDEEGEPDTTAAEAVVERFVEAGVSGISTLGSTGEFSHLTMEERKRFAEALVGIVGGRVPLVVGVGAAGTREAMELARHAGEIGADGVLCVSPFYWKVGEEALFRHFAAVAEASPVPVLVYNFPMLTGLDLSPALVARIARECPNVVGLKDTVTEPMNTVRILREVERVRPDFAVLAGFEDGILPTLLAGGDGAISGLANVAPELFVELVRSARNGDLRRAAELHRRALALMPLYALSDPGMGAIKLAMHRLGVPINPAVRGPALPASPESAEAVDKVLVEAGLLTSASRATG
jgi:4-hydroxy-tetrahydrodipicolinate synthase